MQVYVLIFRTVCLNKEYFIVIFMHKGSRLKGPELSSLSAFNLADISTGQKLRKS